MNTLPPEEPQYALPAPEGHQPPTLVQPRWLMKLNRVAERVGSSIDQLNHMLVPVNEQLKEAPENIGRRPIVFGVWLTIMVFGVFGLWAALAPLESAAVAPGQVIVDTNRKTIQHLEGGIVGEILVREGDIVEANQPLIRLDATTANARTEQLRGQYIGALANEARLVAERDGLEDVTFPDEVTQASKEDSEVAANVEAQRQLFTARRENLTGQINVLDQRINQFNEEINGLNRQISANSSQIGLLSEEIAVVKTLLERGNAVRPRLLALQRQSADLQGQKGQHQASVARARQQIDEAKIQQLNLRTDFLNKSIAELKDTQLQIADYTERLNQAKDIQRRIDITSPIAGQVTGLNVHTVGGVVTPGQKLLDIVPLNEDLIVEARVNPQDIDEVHPGLIARVHLTAYRRRAVPPVDGKVLIVSADRFQDERTGVPYYLARIAIDPEELKSLKGVELSPGMPADAFIITGSRTMLQYLFQPVRDSILHSFRES